MSVRVGVIGALGRVGRMVCSAVEDAPDLELVAGIDKGDSLDQLVAAGCEVVVDFTHPDVVLGDVEFLVAHGIHAVVGTTGWTPERSDRVRALLADAPGGFQRPMPQRRWPGESAGFGSRRTWDPCAPGGQGSRWRH